MNIRIYFILLSLLVASFSWAVKEKRIQESIVINRIGFEDPQELAGWKSQKGSLSLSAKHQKQGNSALLWQWKKGDKLTAENLLGLEKACGDYAGGQPEIFEPAFYGKGKYGGIKMWVYQEEPNSGSITFQVGHSSKDAASNPKYKFSIQLNFKGWRAVWVQFNEDAKVENYQGADDMHSLLAIPSKEASKGSIYIDHFHLLEFISYKRHSDLIIQNNKAVVRTDSYEILSPWKKYQAEKQQQSSVLIDEQAVSSIENRLEYLMLGGEEQLWKKHYADLEAEWKKKSKKAHAAFSQLNIQQKDDAITGRSLFASRDEHGTPDGLQFQAVMQETMFPLAIDYRLNGSEDSKDKLLQIIAYLNDQGWAAGSALGTVDHVIRLNGFATGVFLVRKDLSEESLRTQQECLAWHTRIGNIIDGDHSIGENTDLVRGGALPKLISILLMPNGAEKANMMVAFKKYMDYVASFAPGYADTFKPDFSVYHHRGTYLNSYGIQAINTMTMIRWLLHGTSYALSVETDQQLKKALKRQYEIAHGLKLHPGVCGRFPYKNSGIDRCLLPAYAFMSLNEQVVDDEQMGGIFNYLYALSPAQNLHSILFPALTYSGTYGTLNLLVALHRQMKNTATPPADGNYSMPYSCLSVHRRGKWLAAVKGYSKYIWDYETGHQGENNLGRYLSHGALFLFNTNPKDNMKSCGIDMNEGYHWGYLPGATTKALPIEAVYYENKPTEKYKEGFHRSFSETTFAGGLTAEGRNGLFAFELRDDVSPTPNQALFDCSFRAHKSYFFFDNEILCLGSNIQNKDAQHQTVTTLFQYNIGAHGLKERETKLNGKSIGTSLEINQRFAGGVLTDVQGMQYVVSKHDSICLMQSNQPSLQQKNRSYQAIAAPHVKAYINHGSQPSGESYEYLILPDATPEEALVRVENPGYEVWQKDSAAHIVRHRRSRLTGYAIFDGTLEIDKGIVAKVDSPLMLLAKEEGKNAVLSVCNPDLKLQKWNHNMSVMPKEIVHEWSQGSLVSITLRGNWKPAGYVYELLSSSYENGETQLKVCCKDGKSIDIPLRKQ